MRVRWAESPVLTGGGGDLEGNLVVPGRRRWRLVRQVGNGVAAACASAAVLVPCAVGVCGLPALGPVLDPGRGAWASAAGGLLPQSQVLEVPGLAGAVAVSS